MIKLLELILVIYFENTLLLTFISGTVAIAVAVAVAFYLSQGQG